MAKILYGAQRSDFLCCQDIIDILEWADHEVLKISDAGQLFEAMISGQGDLVILFGGPMALGSLANQIDDAALLISGLQAVALAHEEGCEMPVVILETFHLPLKIRELSNTTILQVPCDPGRLLGEVEELLA